jgi:hypothetical protein
MKAFLIIIFFAATVLLSPYAADEAILFRYLHVAAQGAFPSS